MTRNTRTTAPLLFAAIILTASCTQVAHHQIAQPATPLDPLTNDPAYSITLAAAHPHPDYFPSPADWRDHVLYQLLTDRFDDGDPANNTAHPTGKFDPKDRNAIHGGDFKGVENRLDYVKSLGATAVWISPVQLNVDGHYHGYHTTDFTRIDPHWGTMKDLQHLVAAAHARNLRVIIDVICNHTADLIEQVDAKRYLPPPNEYQLRWRSDKRYPPPFDTLDAFHAHGPIDKNVPESVVLGDLSNLDDIKTEREEFRQYFIKVFEDLITATDCDGFRIDTTKHVEVDFWKEWCPAIHQHATQLGKNNFLLFGEAWIYQPPELVKFLADQNGTPIYDSLLDFPGMDTMSWVFAHDTSGTVELKRASDAALATYPPHARDHMVRFLDNHDGKRFLTVAAENQSTESLRLARLRLATTWLLTTGGVPVIYYGTEQAFSGVPRADGWANSREDMFAGSFEAGPSLGDNFNPTHPLFQHIQTLTTLRSHQPALRDGTTQWLAVSDKPGLVAYDRRPRTDSDPTIRVLLNTSETDTIPAGEIEQRTTLGPSLSLGHILLQSPPDTAALDLPPQGIRILSIPAK